MGILLLLIFTVAGNHRGWSALNPEEFYLYIHDSDEDGIPDGEELDIGSNPLDSDTDRDGFNDYEERIHGSYFGYNLFTPTLDSDRDGLSDKLERNIETDPFSVDTDGDGFSDLDEYLFMYYGYDPVKYTEENNEIKSSIPTSPQSLIMKQLIEKNCMDSSLMTMLPESKYLVPFLKNKEIFPSLALLSLTFCFVDSLYYTYDEMVEKLGNIWLSNQDITQLYYFSPPTYDGRRIWALKISDNPKENEEDEIEVLYIGNHHARELISVEAAMKWIEVLLNGYRESDPQSVFIVNEREIWVIPMLNPDGHFMCERNYNWRKNTHWYPDYGQTFENRGVDLNRNYPYNWQYVPDPNSRYWSGPWALSEREDSAVVLLSEMSELVNGFSYSVSWHSWIQGEGGHQYSWILFPHFPESHRTLRKIAEGDSLRISISNYPRPGYKISWEYTTGTHEAYQIMINRTLALLVELFGVQTEGEPNFCLPYPCDSSVIVCDTFINPLSRLTYTRVLRNAVSMAKMNASFLKGKIRKNLTVGGEVYLTGDVVILDSAVLTIKPGTKVYILPFLDEIKGGYDTTRVEVVVFGKLLAEGNDTVSIEFTSFTSTPSNNDWFGIVVKRNGQLIMSHTRLSNSIYGILLKGGVISLKNSKVESNGYCSVYIFKPKRGSILRGNIIEGKGGDIGIYCKSVGNSFELSHNIIKGFDYAGVVLENSSPNIFSNTIVENNHCGIYLKGSSPLVRENAILRNFIGIEVLSGSSPLLGEEGDPRNPGLNEISATGFLIRYTPESSWDTLRAENNYWGTTSPSDSLFSGPVDYIPWLPYSPFTEFPDTAKFNFLPIAKDILEVNLEYGTIKIEIYDIAGRKVKSFELTPSESNSKVLKINLNDLRAGIYFLQIFTKDKIKKVKFILLH